MCSVHPLVAPTSFFSRLNFLTSPKMRDGYEAVLEKARQTSEQVGGFSVPIPVVIEHRDDASAVTIENLRVQYPTVPLDDVLTDGEREILREGGRQQRNRLQHAAPPSWMTIFRPYLFGDAQFSISGRCTVELPNLQLLSVTPVHLWEMLQDPCISYQSGLHFDAFLTSRCAEARAIIAAWRIESGKCKADARTLPEFARLGECEAEIETISRLAAPIKADLARIAEVVLDVPFVRSRSQAYRKQHLL